MSTAGTSRSSAASIHIPGGSWLDGARNVQLETRGHFLPLGDPIVQAAIRDAVESIVRSAPPP